MKTLTILIVLIVAKALYADAGAKPEMSVQECNEQCYIFHTYSSGFGTKALNNLMKTSVAGSCGQLDTSDMQGKIATANLEKLNACNKLYGPDGSVSDGPRCVSSDVPLRRNYSQKRFDERAKALDEAVALLYGRQNFEGVSLSQDQVDAITKKVMQIRDGRDIGKAHKENLTSPASITH